MWSRWVHLKHKLDLFRGTLGFLSSLGPPTTQTFRSPLQQSKALFLSTLSCLEVVCFRCVQIAFTLLSNCFQIACIAFKLLSFRVWSNEVQIISMWQRSANRFDVARQAWRENPASALKTTRGTILRKTQEV